MEWIFIVLTIIFWGMAPVFDKVALKTVNPVLAVSIRMIWSGFLMFLFVIFSAKH